MAEIVILEDRPYSRDVGRMMQWLSESDITDHLGLSDDIEVTIENSPSTFDEAVYNSIEAKRDIACLIIDVMLDGVENLKQFGVDGHDTTRSFDAGFSFIKEVMRGPNPEYQYYHRIPILIWSARKWETWLQEQFNALTAIGDFAPLGYAIKGEKDEETRLKKFFTDVNNFRKVDQSRAGKN